MKTLPLLAVALIAKTLEGTFQCLLPSDVLDSCWKAQSHRQDVSALFLLAHRFSMSSLHWLKLSDVIIRVRGND